MSQPHHFLRETWNKISITNLSQRLECKATKLCVYEMAEYVERGHVKQVLKTRFYFNYFYLLYSDTYTQGSQEFGPNLSFA